MNRIHAGLLAAVAATVAAASSARAGTYSYLSFDAPGCIVTIPTAVNNRGQVVGWCIDGGTNIRPFARSGGLTTLVTIFGGKFVAVNENGIALGSDDSGRTFLYDIGNARVDFRLPRQFVDAVGINNSNILALTRFTPLSRVGEILDHGTRKLLLAPGATQSLVAAINQAGEVVGQSDPDIGTGGPGFVFSKGSYKIIPKPEVGSYLLLTGIDEDGRVLGGVSPSRFVAKGFVYANGKFASVVFPGAQYTVPTALNRHGVMVGSLAPFGQSPASFLRVGEHYYPFNYPGSLATEVGALAEDDTIVGEYESGNGNICHGFIATCAPDQRPCTP